MNKTTNKPDSTGIKQLVESLESTDGMERKKAREELVAIGKDSIPPLCSLLRHPKHIQRWEALKTMEEIGDPISIPMFIQALEDHECDVRWIAAEGLIKLGQKSVKPLLEALLIKSDFVFVLTGAHHVFYDLKKSGNIPEGFPIDDLLSLLQNQEWKGAVSQMASELLHKFKY